MRKTDDANARAAPSPPRAYASARDRREARGLVVREQPRARQKAQPAAVFEREHAALAVHDIDDELRVLPVIELRRAHEERRAADFAELHVVVTDEKLGCRIAHRRRAVAAAAGLVKHDR